jgi:hypothetical protein
MNKFTEDLRQLLSENVLYLTFVKKDNSERKVVATTNLKLLPKDKKPKTDSDKGDNVIPYFDLMANGWRSMKSDTDFLVTGTRKTVPKEILEMRKNGEI